MFSQNIIDTEVKQWRLGLKALVKSAGGHLEYKLSRARCTQLIRDNIIFDIKSARMLYLQLGCVIFYSSNSNRHISRLVLTKRLKFGTDIFTYS